MAARRTTDSSNHKGRLSTEPPHASGQSAGDRLVSIPTLPSTFEAAAGAAMDPPSRQNGHTSRLDDAYKSKAPATVTANGQRQPVLSTPNQPPSAGPYQTNFALPPRTPTYGQLPGSPGHARTFSASSPYSPPMPSPLSFSFPRDEPKPPPIPSSSSLPAPTTSIDRERTPPPPSTSHNRRHSRLHSRNLSVFFPRPGTLPATAIAEDGSQEVEIPAYSDIPAADSSVSLRKQRPKTPLGQGFTFGAKPPPGHNASDAPVPPLMGKTTRRGHHHKHSMSHNFFSFLEPGADLAPPEQLLTQPTPSPVSQWSAPVTPVQSQTRATSPHEYDEEEERNTPIGAIPLTLLQFTLGGWLWVCGQQIGSLSTAGVGYWIVFDSLGLALGSILPGYLRSMESKATRSRRPYGNARLETLFMFAQAVYLLFSAVYVCKETVEHLLMGMGDSDGGGGHHHHHAMYGIDFPLFSLATAMGLVLLSAFVFENHLKLLDGMSPLVLERSEAHESM